jgi:NADP-dependent 3-hydroxy acid dehydrogenase YdfG
VYPGRTATSRQQRLYEKEGKTYRPELLLQPEDIATMIVAALALPETAEVTDINIRPMLKSY